MAGWRELSYLPMAHIAERVITHYVHIGHGTEVTTCPDPAALARYLREVRPEFFLGVPRVWEKLYGGIQAAVAADPEKKAAFSRALEVGRQASAVRITGEPLPPDVEAAWDKVDAAVFANVRALVGLDACRVAITGAAPIPSGVFDFFLHIGLPFSEVYGMSESTGPMTWTPHRIRPGTVGPPIPGQEVRLLDDGEVLCRGGNVFSGYLKDPQRTADVLDEDGWLHSGDIGTFDDAGYLRIVDRKKELIITAYGKNISPANLETAIKSFPLIGQACTIGDGRAYMTALIVLDPDVAPAWAKSQGIKAASLAELAAHPDVRAEIERCVAEANARFSEVEKIKRFTILPAEWLPDSEELTPTMKLKRRGCSPSTPTKSTRCTPELFSVARGVRGGSAKGTGRPCRRRLSSCFGGGDGVGPDQARGQILGVPSYSPPAISTRSLPAARAAASACTDLRSRSWASRAWDG
jgi:long-chain acyl-CoA synthetase